jgi:hypothetical protein
MTRTASPEAVRICTPTSYRRESKNVKAISAYIKSDVGSTETYGGYKLYDSSRISTYLVLVFIIFCVVIILWHV